MSASAIEKPKVASRVEENYVFDSPEGRGDAASQSIAEGWRHGVSKALEREFRTFAPTAGAKVA